MTLLLVSCGSEIIEDPRECNSSLSEEERRNGWELLFDGQSLDKWRLYGEPGVSKGWAIEAGCLTRTGWGGDLITRATFRDFELKLDWRISPSGNSGIFMRGDEGGRRLSDTALEMQILDDERHWDRHEPSHRAGALYDMIAPPRGAVKPSGSWNRVRILARGDQFEFWLNGILTAKFRQGGDRWREMYNKSKFSRRPRYGTLKAGHIGLQDHWDKVWFRAIKVRPI